MMTAALTRSYLAKIALLLVCLATASCDPHPGDQELLTYFTEHRAALEAIVGRFAQHPELSRVAVESPVPTDPTVRDIHDQLGPLKLSLVTRDPASGGLLFVVHEVGIAVSGAGKGLLHAEQLPETYDGKLVDDIDKAFATARQWQKSHESLDVTFVRPIEGPWYLHFETY